MEQRQNRFAPEVPADGPASSSNHGTPPPLQSAGEGVPPDAEFAEPPLVSDALADSVEDRLPGTLDETFPPGSRKPRHDGWGPEQIGGFLRGLAATGVVEHAARLVGRSAQSAYNFRNGRRGRAFARMWDAVLINRTRARVASELSGRSIAGCVSLRKKDGVVVSEYHYYDNRLAMSLLTRLDRLAEKEAPSEAHLRALSEDLEDYIDCVAQGGDAEAFVEERRPAEPEPAAAVSDPSASRPRFRDPDPDLTTFANLAGCRDYLDVDPFDIDVGDLDPRLTDRWSSDQWVRAFRSNFLTWLHASSEDADFGPGTAMRFMFERDSARIVVERAGGVPPCLSAEEKAAIDTADLDPANIWDWSADQIDRAWNSDFLLELPAEFWDALAVADESAEPD